LKKTTNIQNQRLLKPRPLELTAKDEHIVMEHLDTFKANGFELKVDMDQPPTERISLLTQPYSKNVEFGIKGKTKNQKYKYEIIYIYIYIYKYINKLIYYY